MKLYLTLGVAGAGKSTFVNKMVKESVEPLQVLCLDDIRLALGNVYNERTEPVVAAVTDTMGRAFMERKLPLIVDSTCTSKYIAEKWLRMAKEYGYTTYAYFLDTPFDVCCDRRFNKIIIDVLVRQRDQLDELLNSEVITEFDKFDIINYDI